MDVFLASASQWRIAPSGRYAGLDYRGAQVAAAGIGIRWRDVFDDLRVLESEVLELQSAES